MTPDIGRMLASCTAEGPPGAYSCVAAVAASLPASSRLRAVHERFKALPRRGQARVARDPLRAAEYAARYLRCAPAEPGEQSWGLVDIETGRPAFAICNGVAWYVRCKTGIARVHPSRVIAAWGLS